MAIGKDGIEGLALRRSGPPKQIADEKTACRHRKGCCHVGHGPLAGPYPWLSHDLKTIRDRLDARVGSCAHRVCPQDKGKNPDQAYGPHVVAQIAVNASHDGPEIGGVAHYPVAEQHDVGQDEDDEIWGPGT